MNISMLNRDRCTGCAECINICPSHCIEMLFDEEGFLYPSIQMENCTQCGLCYLKCPVVNKCICNEPKIVYGVQRRELDKLNESSSGGIAAVFSEQAIDHHGIVYGCVFDEKIKVRHMRIDNKNELVRLYGSKYVQSDMNEIYSYLKADCENGKNVVFVGTPCQVAGIKNYLNKDYENLLLIDLICHGVPSIKLFNQYIVWLESRIGEDILSYKFRDKSERKWGTVYKYKYKSGYSSGIATKDPYYSAFIYSEVYRESCYCCQYAQIERCGDITIGDFWGYDEVHAESTFNWENGVSAVLVNTEKGKKYFERIKDNIYFVQSSLDYVKRKNHNLYRPAKRPTIRNVFYKKTEKYGFLWAYLRMFRTCRFYLNLGKSIVPKSIKICVKKIIKVMG